jgi:hypothetical protein
MTARRHSRREALGLIGAAAAAGPALAGLEDCTYGFVSACDIDDILWVGEHVVWIGCTQCPGDERRFVDAILRARPGGPVETIAEARVMRWWPFDDKVYAVVGPHNADSTVLFSLPDFRVLATVEDDGDLYRAGAAILRETRAVLSERLPDINRSMVNFRYAWALRKDERGGDEVWWMETGRPDTLRRIARLDWNIRGYLDNDFQHFDGSTVIFPNYSDLVNGRGRGEHDVPTLTVFPDGRTEPGLIPFATPLYSVGFTIQRAASGFVIGIGDTFGEFSGIYRVEGGIWSQIHAGSVNRMSFPMEPGGTRLAWSSRENLPPDRRNRNGLGNRRHELHVTEI